MSGEIRRISDVTNVPWLTRNIDTKLILIATEAAMKCEQQIQCWRRKRFNPAMYHTHKNIHQCAVHDARIYDARVTYQCVTERIEIGIFDSMPSATFVHPGDRVCILILSRVFSLVS